jgi:hypothetical protein
MAKKTKLVRVPLTANNLTKGVINFLRNEGHFAFRVNTMGIPLKDGSGWKRSGSEKGVADVLACLRPWFVTTTTLGTKRSLFVAFEIKIGEDTLSKDQIEFKKNVEQAGGWFVEVRSYAQFRKWYSESIFEKDRE